MKYVNTQPIRTSLSHAHHVLTSSVWQYMTASHHATLVFIGRHLAYSDSRRATAPCATVYQRTSGSGSRPIITSYLEHTNVELQNYSCQTLILGD